MSQMKPGQHLVAVEAASKSVAKGFQAKLSIGIGSLCN